MSIYTQYFTSLAYVINKIGGNKIKLKEGTLGICFPTEPWTRNCHLMIAQVIRQEIKLRTEGNGRFNRLLLCKAGATKDYIQCVEMNKK